MNLRNLLYAAPLAFLAVFLFYPLLTILGVVLSTLHQSSLVQCF